jgi:hypothetical protein
LSSRVEISTPLTSFMRIKEGSFLWDQGSSPYLGDSLHQPPLILAIFYPLATSPLADNVIVHSIVFIALDLLCALMLRAITLEYLSSPETDPACGLLGKHFDFLPSVTSLGGDESTLVCKPSGDSKTAKATADETSTPAEPPAYLFDALPHAQSARGDSGWLPDAVAAVYLLNPLAVLCCAGLSIAAVEHLAFLATLLFALQGRTKRFVPCPP